MVTHRSNLLIWTLCCAALVGCGQRESFVTPLEKAGQLLAAKDYAGATAKCEELLAKDPKDPNAWRLLIQTYTKQGMTREAIEQCNKAIAACPMDWRAYRERMDLNQLLANEAKAAGDEDEFWRLQPMVTADKEEFMKLNPDAAAMYAAVDYKPASILSTPVPQLEKTPDPLEAVDSLDLKADPNDALAADDENNQGGEKEKENSDTQETASEYAERLARESKEIREKELGKELLDPVLPPHLDPTADPVPQMPEKPITRFGLPSREDGSVVVPNFRGNVATGIRPPSSGANDPSDTDSFGPTNRFFLQNQFGITQQGVRTGIGHSPSTTRSSSTARTTSRVPQFRSGLLPQDATDSFGPHLGRRMEDGNMTLREGSTSFRTAPAKPNPNTPILTTALPGTTMLYGVPTGGRSRGGTDTLSTARDPGVSNARPGTTPNRYGKISDPSFTPFGKRPSASSTPTLPPIRTSN